MTKLSKRPRVVVICSIICAAVFPQSPLVANHLQTQSPRTQNAVRQTKQRPPFRWVNRLKEDAYPGVKHAVFRSPSMKTDVGYCIYLPPGYDVQQNAGRRYPVVYYLHGGRPGNETKSVGLSVPIREAMSAGKVPPAIYVFVNGGEVSHYNYPEKHSLGEDVFVKELIPHVDRTYRTIARRSGRALEGFSQGGRGTTRIMFKHPHLFCSAAPGGAGHETEKRISENDGRESETLKFAPGDNTYDLARKYAANPTPKLNVLVFVGDEGFNYENNLAYMEFLRSLKIPFRKLIVPGAPHSAKIIYEKAGLEIMQFHAENFAQARSKADETFDGLARKFLDEFPKFSPVNATTLGDHRFDDELDQIDEKTRQREREFNDELLASLAALDRNKLSRDNQVDFELLNHHLRKRNWQFDRLQQWAWDPTVYTGLAGTAVYGLMARDFAPIERRLLNVAARLEQFRRLYEQIRRTLVAKRVPAVHAETAVKQNRGVVSILDNMVRPHLAKLSEGEQKRLASAMEMATTAVEEHQKWLEDELLPNAGGDFRLGPRLYDEKLAFTLHTPLTRQQIRDRAESELQRVRAEMYQLAKQVTARNDPSRKPPERPTREQQQALIAECLDMAASDAPERDGVIAAAKKSLKIATDFVRDRDLVTIPDDPLDIIIMPEFQRGVSVAYCDSPGPLEVGQKTFYAVAPLPDGWNDRQCESFLREYNVRSIHNLTVHEAMPGHFLQLAHSNRNPSKLRAVLYSGVFVEGWACYTEQMLSEEDFLDGDPLMRLVTLKWYLRTISNSLLDQAIHVDGIRRPEAMQLMTGDTFQEEREAAGKWTRAQLTSAQLSTYFVGYQEHRDMRRAAEEVWSEEFSLKRYHDAVLSFGSPPTRFVRALLLDEDIAE